MGDMSAEPSMEDILASIKRVIKEGETQAAPRRMSPRPVPAHPAASHDERRAEEGQAEEVLELRQPLTPPAPPADQAPERLVPPVPGVRTEAVAPAPAASTEPAPATVSGPAAGSSPSAPAAPGVSTATAAATRDALGALSRLVVRPEAGSDGTLEGLVRDMLRPMLADWLDANLPGLVEDMVAREIARITNRG